MEDYIIFIFSFFAGLTLIIFGIQNLSLGIQSLFSNYIRKIINKLNVNPILTYLFGSLLTFFLQSSSSLSTMSLSYSSSGLLNSNQLVALFLGSSFGALPLLALLSFEMSHIGVVYLAIGFLPMMSSRHIKVENIGRVLFSLGLILLGYSLIIKHPDFLKIFFDWRLSLDYDLVSIGFYLLVMVCVSILVRSSLALLFVLMGLLHVEAISIYLAFILVVGINLGKTFSIFYFSSKKNIQARRGAMIYLVTQVIMAIMSSLLILQFLVVINFFHTQIFNKSLNFIFSAQLFYILAHTFLTLGLFIPIKLLVKRWQKSSQTKEPQKLIYEGPTQWLSPVLGMEQVNYEVKKMSATIESCLGLTKIYLSDGDADARDKILKYETVTDHIQKEVFDYLDRVKQVPLNIHQGKMLRSLEKMADELESIADSCKMMVLSHDEIQQVGKSFDRELILEFNKLFEVLIELYEVSFAKLTQTKSEDIDCNLEFREKGSHFDQRLIDLRKHYLGWLKLNASSLYDADAGTKFNDTLNCLKKIKSHTHNIFESTDAVL